MLNMKSLLAGKALLQIIFCPVSTRLVHTGKNRFVPDQDGDHRRRLLVSQPSEAKLARGL